MSVIATGLTAGAVNVTAAVVTGKHDPFKTALASFFFVGALLGVASVNQGFGEVLGIAFLVSSVLLNGLAVMKPLESIAGVPNG